MLRQRRPPPAAVQAAPAVRSPSPTCQLPAPPPAAYHYVDFVYSGYPYGLQSSGGYPRGGYSPFTGYPYVEPPPGYHAPWYVNYRLGERAGHVYRRSVGAHRVYP